jgi:CTD kinase subunit beta
MNTAFRLPPYWTPSTLTELKIRLRERRPGKAVTIAGWPDTSPAEGDEREIIEGMGRNDATVRFVWD